ncbi:helix-turn-helix domain-containing protein [Kribbella sp. NPDC004875]|uniref:helix-turn-helix transcriptional regulator n=1 Tax=Kribbella sp. NPDC004875 TaxID=3364107 RepID=UPI0036BD0663
MTLLASELATVTPVSVVEYLPGSTYGPRELRDNELVWLLEGTATWRIDNDLRGEGPQEFALSPGVLCLAQAGMVDGFRWSATTTTKHAYLHFSLDELHPDRLAWPLTVPLAGSPLLAATVDHLSAIALAGTEASRQRVPLLARLVLDLMVNGPQLTTGRPFNPLVDALAEYVVTRWGSGHSDVVPLRAAAPAVGVSVGYLSRVFSQEFGCGPSRGLLLIRLRRAATALVRSDLALVAIARSCGFSDQFHLSHRLRDVYRVSPSAFRLAGDSVDLDAPLLRHGRLLEFAQRVTPPL